MSRIVFLIKITIQRYLELLIALKRDWLCILQKNNHFDIDDLVLNNTNIFQRQHN